MDKRWNLNKLYTSFDCVELKNDLTWVETTLKNVFEFTNNSFKDNSNPVEKIKKYLELTEVLGSKIDILYNFGSLTYSVDTTNSDALKLIEKIESYFPEMTLIEVSFRKWLKTIENIDNIINSDSYLKSYLFVINSEKKQSKYLLSDSEEKLLAELKNTGSNAWTKLQDLTVSSLKVDYEGELLPLTVIRNKAYESNAEVRKKAYEAELAAYKKSENASAACLNAIKGEVITEAGKRGYSSPLEMTLISSRMDKETLDAMFTAIDEYLPEFRKYLRKKAELLGHKNGLPFYDLFAPMGEAEMVYNYDEARDFVIKNFSSFSKKLGEYAKTAFDNDWIDPFPRDGKVAGAFCSNIHGIKESRIMSNFDGSFSDVSTLAHELGHGYHGECLKNVSFANSHYPMPLAETASIFCETIIANAAIKTATKEETFSILENSLMGATQVIVDIYSRFLFESEVFEKRKTSSLSVDELKEAMLNAQKKAYGEGLDENFLHPYMWACKPHYYYAGYNFYNFPYAFGLLFAKGLYAKYLQTGEDFIPKYDALLEATGNNSIHDVLKTVDIDSHNPDFFRNSLEIIKKEIDLFLTSK